MSSVFGLSLDDIARAAANAMLTLETRLSRLSDSAALHQQAVEAERSAAQREREELDIEFSLSVGSQFVVDAPDTNALRRREAYLTDEAIRASALQRQMADFSAFIGSASRRFGAQGELPDADAANRAEIRSAAFAAQEQERQRLAREIHDGPAQALANAIVALEFVERAIRATSGTTSERAFDEVERIKGSLRDGLTEIRRFIFDLRPTMLQDRGLPQTVEHYIATYQSVFPMTIEFSATHHLPRLNPDQELASFRIIQEGIQNARKHARATKVAVTIGHVDHILYVIISDNGRGFSPERVTTHLMSGAGIRGMRERAALIGGTLRIDSSPGEGTTVELQAPLIAVDSLAEIAGDEGPSVALDLSDQSHAREIEQIANISSRLA